MPPKRSKKAARDREGVKRQAREAAELELEREVEQEEPSDAPDDEEAELDKIARGWWEQAGSSRHSVCLLVNRGGATNRTKNFHLSSTRKNTDSAQRPPLVH